MLLANGHSRSRLIKEFTGLGPYIRESQCKGNSYFFDCLTVCANSKPSPEKREFWGWWMDLEATEDGFTYQILVGLYDKAGEWQKKTIKDAETQKEIDRNLKEFLQKLQDYLTTLNLSFQPIDTTKAKMQDKTPA